MNLRLCVYAIGVSNFICIYRMIIVLDGATFTGLGDVGAIVSS